MNKRDFLAKLEDIMEMEESGILTGNEELDTLAEWDSIATLEFIIMVDEQFGFTVSASDLEECRTVDDLAKLLGDHLQYNV